MIISLHEADVRLEQYELRQGHWNFIYNVLRPYCTDHTNAITRCFGLAMPVGPYLLGPIDFDAIVMRYFLPMACRLNKCLPPEQDWLLEQYVYQTEHLPRWVPRYP